ncbi:CdaR family transcriptional regulator [Jatrophihabitans sp. GAS493]|uniref:PucR family transcriptional regulator n=1 Tax=Jatrophihabitans sp. GAS493 TaxID=1907575 RepID=UPI000BB6862E|nr:helix-turn-helix domain-containing protein [Jatrophihabitans sp. GAS493]SOD70765.1 CdaR family transcriptional regulator [Jatrophihabitans sp. GAS493]
MSVDPRVLGDVAAGAAADAGGLPVELLGDFLEVVSAAVAGGDRLSAAEVSRFRPVGESAARQGVALRALLDLYLSAGWRLWRHLPAVANAAADPAAVVTAGEVMLHAVDDAVAELAEGYQLARRGLVREQEAQRREFIDDLLSGRGDVAGLLQRASGFGLDLAAPHAVALVRAERIFTDGSRMLSAVERAVQGSKGDAGTMVASKEGQLVVIFAVPDQAAVDEVLERVDRVLGVELDQWQIGVGRPGRGGAGVLNSFDEARESLQLAARLGLRSKVVPAADLLVFRVLLRDRAAMVDLVLTLLEPLQSARGGAEPLLQTLAAYFEEGGNSAQTARRLHLSVRAVTYRLERVRELTGQDPTRSTQRFALQAAVLGAQLLDWPATPLP